MQPAASENFQVKDNFSVEDLQKGLKLARDIRIPIKETLPTTDQDLIN